jgi:hypothetical protein
MSKLNNCRYIRTVTDKEYEKALAAIKSDNRAVLNSIETIIQNKDFKVQGIGDTMRRFDEDVIVHGLYEYSANEIPMAYYIVMNAPDPQLAFCISIYS